MKTRTIAFAMTATLAAAGGASAEEVFIHFEDMNPGDNVAGLGTLYPNLEIQPLNAWGPLTVIQTFNDATKVYKAPNKNAWDIWHTNNALEDQYGRLVDSNALWFDRQNPVYANGFANTDCSWHDSSDGYFCPQEFLITFNHRRVSRFQMLMADFGDWNPNRDVHHQVYLRGYENGIKVAEYAFDYTTDPVAVALWCSEGFNPKVSADASACEESGRGHSHIEVNAPPGSLGFDEVQLVAGDGWDPNTGFDSLRIDYVNLVDLLPTSCPNPIDLSSLAASDELSGAILGTSGFDVAQIVASTCTLEGVPLTIDATSDVSRPYVGTLVDSSSCSTAGPDGHTDLAFKVPRSAVASVVVAKYGNLPTNATAILQLTCELLNGNPFVSNDIMKVVNN